MSLRALCPRIELGQRRIWEILPAAEDLERHERHEFWKLAAKSEPQ